MDEQTPSTRMGPNGKPVRQFVLPNTLSGKLRVWRFLFYRRAMQLGTLLLFYGTAHWSWTFLEQPVLQGNLSASTLLGTIPLADPFAVLQIFLTGHLLATEVVVGALLTLAAYAYLGGRVWCSWVCPINMVTDLAAWIRRRLPFSDLIHINRNLRYTLLLVSLAVSTIAGVAAFEWISPISMVHRELIFGLGAGWMAVLGIFLLDLFVSRGGWCGRLCPLGAFYGVVGKVAAVRLRFDTPTCTHCGECARVCPEPQVLNLKKASELGYIASGECTNCARCVSICPENTLQFDLRSRINHSQTKTPNTHQRSEA